MPGYDRWFSVTLRMIIGVDQRQPSSNLNATLAYQISPSRELAAVRAGLVPAIQVPDKISFRRAKDMDHRVKPGDDNYASGLLPNLPRYFVFVQAGACDDDRRITALT
jgi:hypothetical protein